MADQPEGSWLTGMNCRVSVGLMTFPTRPLARWPISLMVDWIHHAPSLPRMRWRHSREDLVSGQMMKLMK